jgi:restriction endonuclease S subunit
VIARFGIDISILVGSVQGQTRPGLNGGLIKRIRVPIPPMSLDNLLKTGFR